jgi:hypothetical protein
VVGLVVIGTAYSHRGSFDLHIKSVYASVPPKASQTAPPSRRRSTAFAGDAPWALSALPECFKQRSKSTGPLRYVEAQLPLQAAMVRPPATLRFADCTVSVRDDRIVVTRGPDRLRVPPPARLYRGSGTLALLRGADGGYDLRIYSVQP